MDIYEYGQQYYGSSLFPSEKEDETTSTDDTKVTDPIDEALKKKCQDDPKLRSLISKLLLTSLYLLNGHIIFRNNSNSKLNSHLVDVEIKFPKDTQKLLYFRKYLFPEINEDLIECVFKEITKEEIFKAILRSVINYDSMKTIQEKLTLLQNEIPLAKELLDLVLEDKAVMSDQEDTNMLVNFISLFPENDDKKRRSSIFPLMDKVNKVMSNTHGSVGVHGDHEKNNPLAIVIDSKKRKIHDEIKNHTHLVKYYTSVEDYRNAFPDSEKRSHLIIFAHPTTKDELNPLFNMKQVRKVIINCEEKRRTEFESLAKENPLRVVVLRQIDLVVVSTLMNLSKMLKEAANVASETGEKDLALERYELALNLNLESSELLKRHREKDEDK